MAEGRPCYFLGIGMGHSWRKKICGCVLVTDIFLRFGVPMMLHTDHGSEFRSDLMREISEWLEIRMSRTALYHPQSDGQVERFNRNPDSNAVKTLRGAKRKLG